MARFGSTGRNHRWWWPCASLLVALALVGESRAEPFRLCAFSFNSPDELGVFEARLSPAEFEILDLSPHLSPVPASAERPGRSWVLDLCRPDIRCDVVVYSGEFAGRFFGRYGRSVTLEDMEEASCQTRCAGLFRPQEVFLLACNTLATKDEDTRTPHEYLQVLVDHGFDHASAERVVELRYGPLGPSFRESLRRIFAGVPRIYGFASIAPRAELTVPRLVRYFQTKGDYGRYLDGARGDARPNRELLAAFGQTALVQTSGLGPTERSAVDRALVCRVYDDGSSIDERLAVVQEMVARPDFLSFVPTLEVFFNRHPPEALRDGARERFAAIQQNESAREQVLGLVRDLQVSAVKMEIAHLARQLDWMSEDAFRRLAVDGARQLLAQPLTSEVVDIMCEIDKHETVGGDVRAEEISGRLFEEAEGIRLVDCLAPADKRVSARLLPALDSPDEATRLWAAYALSRRLPLDDDALRVLARFANDPSADLRERVQWILQQPGPTRRAQAAEGTWRARRWPSF